MIYLLTLCERIVRMEANQVEGTGYLSTTYGPDMNQTNDVEVCAARRNIEAGLHLCDLADRMADAWRAGEEVAEPQDVPPYEVIHRDGRAARARAAQIEGQGYFSVEFGPHASDIYEMTSDTARENFYLALKLCDLAELMARGYRMEHGLE
ncbi:hypothetical protein ACQPW1_10510 [Nocardia sp. CA-128927]|uniref:hypothetical protein n=1 Tax=Nocardia sp. CA-128927 TaxID=3239975 RepID=UPI003D9579CF